MLGEEFTEYENGKAIHKYKFTEAQMQKQRAILWDFLERVRFEELPGLIDKINKVELYYYDLIKNKMPHSQELHEVTSELAAMWNNFYQSPFANRKNDSRTVAPYIVKGPLNQYFNIDTFLSLLNKLNILIEDRAMALEHCDSSKRDSLRLRQQIVLEDERDAMMEFHGGTATFEFWCGVLLLISALIYQRQQINAGKGMVQQQLSSINISVNDESALAILLSPLLLIIFIYAMMLKKHAASLVDKDMKETLEKVRSVKDVICDVLRIDIANKLYDDLNQYWTTGTSKHFLSSQGDMLGNFAGAPLSREPKLITQNGSMLFADQGNKSKDDGVIIKKVQEFSSARPT